MGGLNSGTLLNQYIADAKVKNVNNEIQVRTFFNKKSIEKKVLGMQQSLKPNQSAIELLRYNSPNSVEFSFSTLPLRTNIILSDNHGDSKFSVAVIVR